MKSQKYWMILYGWVILLFVSGMFFSIIPDYIRGFLQDVQHISSNKCYEGLTSYYENEAHWHWGYRHYLFAFLGIVLFFINIIRIFIWVNNNEDNLN